MFNLWFFLSVAVVCYYVSEVRTAKYGQKKQHFHAGQKLLITEKELPYTLGLNKKDTEEFLKKYADKIQVFELDGKKAYSVQEIKDITDSKKNES